MPRHMGRQAQRAYLNKIWIGVLCAMSIVFLVYMAGLYGSARPQQKVPPVFWKFARKFPEYKSEKVDVYDAASEEYSTSVEYEVKAKEENEKGTPSATPSMDTESESNKDNKRKSSSPDESYDSDSDSDSDTSSYESDGSDSNSDTSSYESDDSETSSSATSSEPEELREKESGIFIDHFRGNPLTLRSLGIETESEKQCMTTYRDVWREAESKGFDRAVMRKGGVLYKLPIEFDPTQLSDDLQPLRDKFTFRADVNNYFHLIYTTNGTFNEMKGGPFYPYGDTIAKSPIIRSVFDALGTPIGRARFMLLKAGESVKGHVDFKAPMQVNNRVFRMSPHVGYWGRRYRVHVVFDTNPNVMFVVNGNGQHVPAGQVFVFENGESHIVKNTGETDRVHLVFDVVGGSRFMDLLNRATLYNSTHHWYEGPEPAAQLSKPESLFFELDDKRRVEGREWEGTQEALDVLNEHVKDHPEEIPQGDTEGVFFPEPYPEAWDEGPCFVPHREIYDEFMRHLVVRVPLVFRDAFETLFRAFDQEWKDILKNLGQELVPRSFMPEKTAKLLAQGKESAPQVRRAVENAFVVNLSPRDFLPDEKRALLLGTIRDFRDRVAAKQCIANGEPIVLMNAKYTTISDAFDGMVRSFYHECETGEGFRKARGTLFPKPAYGPPCLKEMYRVGKHEAEPHNKVLYDHEKKRQVSAVNEPGYGNPYAV